MAFEPTDQVLRFPSKRGPLGTRLNEDSYWQVLSTAGQASGVDCRPQVPLTAVL